MKLGLNNVIFEKTPLTTKLHIQYINFLEHVQLALMLNRHTSTTHSLELELNNLLREKFHGDEDGFGGSDLVVLN